MIAALLRPWFLRHWFAAVFLILTGIWVATTVAYVLGAEGISFSTRYGPPATIDFMRKHDRPVVGVGDRLGLELDDAGPKLRGTLLELDDALPVVGLLCGREDTKGAVAQVGYRDGDWLYREPVDASDNHEARNGRRQQSRDFILTLAYNVASGERIIADVDDSLEVQALELSRRGLATTSDAALSVERLNDLPTLSIQREGCVVYNAAFVGMALFWFIIGGPIWLLVRARRSRTV